MDIVPTASPASPIRALAEDYPAGHRIAWHTHDAGQLIHAISGTMRITTEGERWLSPPLWGVWVPVGVAHCVEMTTAVQMRTVYVAPAAHPALPKTCQVIEVGPVLTALVRAIAAEAEATREGRRLRHALLLEELAVARLTPFVLPLGVDPRLQRATDRLMRDPAAPITLEILAAEAGASGRTLMRLFERETGLSFGRWRQRQRLIEALERLGRGEPVGLVAARLGYASSSAFGAMVRRATGCPPSAFSRQAGSPSHSLS